MADLLGNYQRAVADLARIGTQTNDKAQHDLAKKKAADAMQAYMADKAAKTAGAAKAK